MKKHTTTARLLLQRLLGFTDGLLDRLTVYRLVLYFLIALTSAGIIVSLFGGVGFAWYEIVFSAAWLSVVCFLTNSVLSRRFDIPQNRESNLITALILALILTPPGNLSDLAIISIAAAAAMASKYYLVLGRRHIFNPAALGVFVTGTVFQYYPSWWVGTKALLPLTLIGGLLILRKIRRFYMALIFIAVYLVVLASRLIIDIPAELALRTVWMSLLASPLVFFAVIMLTEPLTSPRLRRVFFIYAAAVALLYGLPAFDLRLEESLLLGNMLVFLLDPNPRMALKFLRRRPEAEGIESFIFKRKQGLKFLPGQYLEWTMPSRDSDSRGNRRYLTISSSPTEKDIMFTIRTPEKMSSYKRHLKELRPGGQILAFQLSGDFLLPRSESQKLAFIAGGVGITPFRSMVKYLLDFNQERPIRLIYAASGENQFAFRDLFKEAEKIGLQTDYVLTADQPPAGWQGKTGRIDANLIKETVEDFRERIFYISGPQAFVHGVSQELIGLGLPARQIKTDFFPGYG